MKDTIYREDAIEAVKKRLYETAMNNMEHGDIYADITENRIGIWLSELPPALEPKGGLIRRAEAIDAVCRDCTMELYGKEECEVYKNGNCGSVNAISALPSAERNCFTCGMEDGVMAFNPEKVGDEVLDADAKLVRLSDVCKLIQENYEVSPYVWGKLRSLPSAEAVQGWIPCSERLPSESGTYLTTTAKGSVCTDHFYANSNDICGRHWSYHRRREPIAWMPLPNPYTKGDYE